MKAKILSQSGKAGEIEFPAWFSNRIREDIAQKFYEISKKQQPYAPFYMAGKQHSASGILSKSRRLWKNTYGKGISRVPRKIFWRRGDHFYWQGAEIASARGGRPAHPPRTEHFTKKLKMNKNETVIALQSVMASTVYLDFIRRRYSTLSEIKLELPLVINSDLLKLKTKQFYEFLEKILGDAWRVSLKQKSQRAGKGKGRNRRYKENAGLLLVVGNSENVKLSGIDVKKVEDIEISDLYPLGRLTIYTEKAVKELNEVKNEK